MKNIIMILFISTPLSLFGQNKCDVENFYTSVDMESDAKVLTRSSSIEDVECVLVPTKIDAGEYTVSITKKLSNFYKIDGKDIFIETKYCYEYAAMKKAILIVTSSYGYTKGEIIFIQ